jgi:hypothetical protein
MLDPYKSLDVKDIKKMRLSDGWLALRAVTAAEKTSIITTDSSADYRNALYHEVINAGSKCKREVGEFCFVLGNTLSAADPSFRLVFCEDQDVVASWGESAGSKAGSKA